MDNFLLSLVYSFQISDKLILPLSLEVAPTSRGHLNILQIDQLAGELKIQCKSVSPLSLQLYLNNRTSQYRFEVRPRSVHVATRKTAQSFLRLARSNSDYSLCPLPNEVREPQAALGFNVCATYSRTNSFMKSFDPLKLNHLLKLCTKIWLACMCYTEISHIWSKFWQKEHIMAYSVWYKVTNFEIGLHR